DGRLRALPDNPIALATSDLLTWRGKLALLGEPFVRPASDEESLHDLAARRLGPEAARAIAGPFVTGVYAADAREISARGGFPRVAELDAAGGFVRGLAKRAVRGLAARVVGRGSARTARGLWAPMSGLGALIDALAGSLDSRFRTGVRVRGIIGDSRQIEID